ncbi:hypothetical protein OE88DRAFT_1648927 [Heliocybe sulcata]|uniref:Uncharacterized protein n=1 Tax=Heliocybe sulcata TaxID=5364 RepID=A0A5C3MKH9_9AGAM|nr:hypothetical protein OE88DRAFT_1648927 [Heliocybe sulcata]
MSSSVINKQDGSPTKASGSSQPDKRTQSALGCTEQLTTKEDAKSKVSDVVGAALFPLVHCIVTDGDLVKGPSDKIADGGNGHISGLMASEKSHAVPQEGPSLKSDIESNTKEGGDAADKTAEKVAPHLDSDLARGMDKDRQDGIEEGMRVHNLSMSVLHHVLRQMEWRVGNVPEEITRMKVTRQDPPASDHIAEETDYHSEVMHCACHKLHPESSHTNVHVWPRPGDSCSQGVQNGSPISLQDIDAAKALLQPTKSTDGREETSDVLLSLEGSLTWIDPASGKRLELIEEAAPRLRSLALRVSDEYISSLAETCGEQLLQLEELHLDKVFTDSTPMPDEAELFSCFKMESLTVLSVRNFALSSIHPLLSSTVRNLCVSGDLKTFSNAEILGMLLSVPRLCCLRLEGYIRADNHEGGPEDQVVLRNLEELYVTMMATDENTIRWITAVRAPVLRWVEFVIPQPWSKRYGENRTGMVLDVMKLIILQVTDNNIARVARFDAPSDYRLQLQLMNGFPSTRIQGVSLTFTGVKHQDRPLRLFKNRFGHRLSSVKELQITGKAYTSKALDEWSDMFNLMSGVRRLLLRGQAVKSMPYGIGRGSVHDHDTYFPCLETVVMESVPFSWAPRSSRETFKTSLLSSLEDRGEATQLNNLTISESDGIIREDIEAFRRLVKKVIWIQDGKALELEEEEGNTEGGEQGLEGVVVN